MEVFSKELNPSRIVGRKRRFVDGVYYFVSFMSLGLFHVLCATFPRIKLQFETRPARIESADTIVYKGCTYNVNEETIENSEITDILCEYVRDGKYKYVFIQSIRRVYNWVVGEYVLPSRTGYMEELNRVERRVLFGRNELAVKNTSNFKIFFDSVFDFINVYTMLGILLWIYIEYKIYALIIFILMAYNLWAEICTEVNKNNQSKKISKMKKKSFLLEKGQIGLVEEGMIVMNDLLVMIPYSEVPCDCVVVDGTVAVDEGFVTGESVPVMKKKNNEILAGSIVLQALVEKREEIYTVEHNELEKFIESNNSCNVKTVRISYESARGKAFLNLSLQKLNIPPVYYDTLKMIGAIGVMLIPCAISVFIYLRKTLTPDVLIFYILDLIYALVSPSLPTAIWIGMSMCAKRLQKKKIHCKDISISNISGNITKVCFDKTGTLTEEGLDVKCVNIGGVEVFSINEIADSVIRQGLSMCHSVEKIGERLVGDPLDIKLLQFAKGAVEYSSENEKIMRTVRSQGIRVGVIKDIFDFDPNIRRMTVVSEREDGTEYVFTKGSTEAIDLISEKNDENTEVVSEYTKAGYRVISLAGKTVNKEISSREDAESGLSILCTIVFENKIKSETTKTIDILNKAGLSTIMCTGDALLTAVSVGMHCGIIEQHIPVIYPKLQGKSLSIDNIEWVCVNDDVVFDKVLMKVKKGLDYSSYIDYAIAIEGSIFNLFMESVEYKKLLQRRCKVFARMNPQQKSAVVHMYKETDLVCFVGDGANDCSAIQAADVGVSLSNSESSIEYCASSYLSYRSEISCLLDIIKEGKCTLTTTLGKIEQILIITISQFNALLILLFKKLFMSDMQNIYTDIFINIPLSILMSRFKSAKTLSRKKPKKRLLKSSIIYGIFIHCFTHSVHLFVLLKYFQYLGHIDFVDPNQNKLSEISQLGSGIFLISNMQALYSGLEYTPGEPFRTKKRENTLFVGFYILHCILLSLLLISVSNTSASDNFILTKLKNTFDLMSLSVEAVIGICILSVTDIIIIQMLTRLFLVLNSS